MISMRSTFCIYINFCMLKLAVIFLIKPKNQFKFMYHIAGNFRGRKLSWIGGKGAFRGENFRGMLKVVA